MREVFSFQTGLVRRGRLIATRPVWSCESIWVIPDRSGNKVMTGSNQTGPVRYKYIESTKGSDRLTLFTLTRSEQIFIY